MVVADSLISSTRTLPHRRFAATYYMSWLVVKMRLSMKSADDTKKSLTTLKAYYTGATNEQARILRLYRVQSYIRSFNVMFVSKYGFSSMDEDQKLMIIDESKFYGDEEALIGWPMFWDWNWCRQDARKYPKTSREKVARFLGATSPRRLIKRELEYFMEILESEPFTGEE